MLPSTGYNLSFCQCLEKWGDWWKNPSLYKKKIIYFLEIFFYPLEIQHQVCVQTVSVYVLKFLKWSWKQYKVCRFHFYTCQSHWSHMSYCLRNSVYIIFLSFRKFAMCQKRRLAGRDNVDDGMNEIVYLRSGWQWFFRLTLLSWGCVMQMMQILPQTVEAHATAAALWTFNELLFSFCVC